MANEISTLTDLNGVTHDIEDSTARSAIQTLDGQTVKSVNGQTPTAGAVLIGAGNIGYDNTSSGMTADDLQEAVDELNGTLSSHTGNSTIHVTASDKANWNAKADDSAVVKSVNSVNPVTGNVTLNADNIPADGYGNKSVSGNPITITDGTATTAKNLDVSLTPIQDLHGYDNPWPAGGGKNLIPLTVEGIKAANTDGSWSGNVYTISGGTFTILTDNGGNVTGIKINGTFSGQPIFLLGKVDFYAGNTYLLNGSLSNPSDFRTAIMTKGSDYGNGYIYTPSVDDLARAVLIFCNNNPTADNLIFNPMIRLSTETDPTYAPYSNICPISGYDSVSVKRTGKNLFDDSTWIEGMINPDTGALIPFNAVKCSDYIKVNPSAWYTISSYSQNDFYNPFSIFAYDANKHYLGTVNYTVITSSTTLFAEKFQMPSNASYFRMHISKATLGNSSYQQVEEGDTVTDYEPYQGSTATISLSSAGTVYKGTVDFDTGLVTVTHAIGDLGDLSWTKSGTLFYTNQNPISGIGNHADSSTKADCVCTNYPTETEIDVDGNNVNVGVSIGPDGARIRIRDANSSYTDAATFKTAMSDVKLVYPLATPLTYQLTPAQLTLLNGYNYVTSNGTTISLDYYGSEATNVQAEIAEFETNLDRLAGSIAQIEESPATATHKVGDLIVWDSQLYRVTSAIAVGETLSVGSNVAYTNAENEFREVYSTAETRIGTWIDGSPIYRKVFEFGSEVTINNLSWTDLGSSFPVSYYKQIVQAYGYNANYNAYLPFMVSRSATTNLSCLACRDGAIIAIQYIVLEYTKN